MTSLTLVILSSASFTYATCWNLVFFVALQVVSEILTSFKIFNAVWRKTESNDLWRVSCSTIVCWMCLTLTLNSVVVKKYFSWNRHVVSGHHSKTPGKMGTTDIFSSWAMSLINIMMCPHNILPWSHECPAQAGSRSSLQLAPDSTAVFVLVLLLNLRLYSSCCCCFEGILLKDLRSFIILNAFPTREKLLLNENGTC